MSSVRRSWASTSLKSACGSLPGSGAGLPDDDEGKSPHLEGEAARDSRALDSGKRAHALEHAVVEPLDLGRHHVHVLGRLVEVARPSEEDVGGEDVARVEPGQLLLLAQEGAHHQARAHEQDHRQPDLGHQQGGPAALARPAAPASSFLQDVVEIDARGAQGGQEAEDEAGGDGDDEGKRHHAQVDVHVAQQLREAGGDDEGEEARAPEREHEAAAAPDEGQDEVLGQELPHEPAPAGSGGRAQGELLLPRRARGQQQVRDVGAGDEQDEADRAQQEREHVLGAAEEGLLDGDEARALASGFLAPGLEHVPADRGDLGLGRRHRDPRLQASDDGDPARLGNLAEVVRGPEGDAVFPGHELESRRHHPDHRPRLAVHVEGRPDDVVLAAEAALPRLVGDDDGRAPPSA